MKPYGEKTKRRARAQPANDREPACLSVIPRADGGDVKAEPECRFCACDCVFPSGCADCLSRCTCGRVELAEALDKVHREAPRPKLGDVFRERVFCGKTIRAAG